MDPNLPVGGASLDRLFRPASVAVIGASPVRGNQRNSLVRILLQHGFAGRVYPVTPSHKVVEGLQAYASVAQLPEVPDVALIITPAATVPALIDECGAKGIRHAIVFSAGFEESEEGKALSARLIEAARRHGITLVGPNCQGIWSVKSRALMTFSPAALHLEQARHAPIAIVSQSGALAGSMASGLNRNGIGCAYMVSVGNQAVFDALDALEWLVEQDDVRVVALYIEGLKEAQRIGAIAHRARQRGVRIVALKAGRSEIGLQTTASHTGRMASSYAVHADCLEQAGVLAMRSLSELMMAVEVLAFMDFPRPGGDLSAGVSVLSSSGGAAALLADHAGEQGVPLARFGSATMESLGELLPAHARMVNPVDLVGQVGTNADLFRNTGQAIAADPRTEVVVFQHANSGRRFLAQDGDFYKQLARQVPVVVSFVNDALDLATRKEYLDAGVLLSPDPSVTMLTLSWLYRLRSYQALSAPAVFSPAKVCPAPQDWQGVMDFCEGGGATVARWVVLDAAQRAAQTCARMAYPVAVKALPADADHKSELGLVRLAVTSTQQIDEVAAEFRQRMGKPTAGILVQEMAHGGVEVVLSFLRQTDFGPVLSIGMGGVAVELHRDIAHLALPVTAQQVRHALGKLKLWTLLQGFRGKPPADVEALVEAAVSLGNRFLACPDLHEFELNPVIVHPHGQGLHVVDALANPVEQHKEISV